MLYTCTLYVVVLVWHIPCGSGTYCVVCIGMVWFVLVLVWHILCGMYWYGVVHVGIGVARVICIGMLWSIFTFGGCGVASMVRIGMFWFILCTVQVLDFHGPFTLPPTSEWHRPFALQFQPTSSECLFNTTLRLSTNASLFNIPFYCYDGRVMVSVVIHLLQASYLHVVVGMDLLFLCHSLMYVLIPVF